MSTMDTYFASHHTALFAISDVRTDLERAARLFATWDEVGSDQCQSAITTLLRLKEAVAHMIGLYGEAMPTSVAATRHTCLASWFSIAEHITALTAAMVSYKKVCRSLAEDDLSKRVRLLERTNQLIVSLQAAFNETLKWRHDEMLKLNAPGRRTLTIVEIERKKEVQG